MDTKPLYGFHIWGPCPRCGHPSNGLVPVKYLATAPLGDEPIAVPVEGVRVEALRLQTAFETGRGIVFRTDQIVLRPVQPGYDLKAVVMTCRCPVTHDVAHGNTGCGAEWMVAFEYVHGAGKRDIVLSAVNSVDAARMWVAADAVSASIAVAGQTAMGLASKWVAVLTTVVAVITLGGVLGGHDTIQALPVCAQAALGIATLVALVANACMIYQGNIAGNGYPALKAALDERSLIQADIEPLRDAEAAIDRLGCARNWAIVTGGATLVAVGLFLFVPPADAGHVKVKYTDSSSVVYQTGCGTYDATAKSFTPDHGKAPDFSGAKAVEVDAC